MKTSLNYHQEKLRRQRLIHREMKKRQMVEDILRLLADPPGVAQNPEVKFIGFEPKPENVN